MHDNTVTTIMNTMAKTILRRLFGYICTDLRQFATDSFTVTVQLSCETRKTQAECIILKI